MHLMHLKGAKVIVVSGQINAVKMQYS